MKLKDFLDKKNMSMYSFAKLLGVTHQTISNIAILHKEPSLSVATRIEELTLGEVKCSDMSKHKLRRTHGNECDVQEKNDKGNSKRNNN